MGLRGDLVGFISPFGVGFASVMTSSTSTMGADVSSFLTRFGRRGVEEAGPASSSVLNSVTEVWYGLACAFIRAVLDEDALLIVVRPDKSRVER